MDIIEDSYTKKEFRRNKGIYLKIKLIIAAGCLILLSFLLYSIFKVPITPIVLVSLAIMFFIAFKIMYSFLKQNKNDVKRNDNTWGKGLEAEEEIGKSLLILPPEYKVIEDLYTGKGNIDAIVIGPAGLFIIEIKAKKGKVSYHNQQLTVNGRIPEKDYIAQTEAEKFWLTNTLKQNFNTNYPITAVLEFPYGYIDKRTINGPIEDNIWIGEKTFHNYLINNSRNHLSPDEIERIYAFLNTLKENKSVHQ